MCVTKTHNNYNNTFKKYWKLIYYEFLIIIFEYIYFLILNKIVFTIKIDTPIQKYTKDQ